MIHVKVVAAVGLGHVLVRIAKVPLSPSRAGVIAWRGDAEHSIHSQNPAANVLPMEVAAEADLFHLDFVRPENLGRPADRVILGMVKAADKVGVESDLWSKEFRIPHCVFVARRAVEPGPVGVGKWGLGVHRRRSRSLSGRGLRARTFALRLYHRYFLI